MLLLSLGLGVASAQVPGFNRVPQDVLEKVPIEVLRGDQQLQSGRYLLALDEYLNAIERVGTNPDLEVRAAKARFGLSQCERAIAEASPFRSMAIWTGDTSRLAASCFARRGHYSEAVYWQEEAVLLDPMIASNWIMLGVYRARQGDSELADLAFYEGAWLDPQATSLWVARGSLALDLGDFDTVEQVRIQLDVGRERSHPMGQVLGARMALDLGEPEEAVKLAMGAMVQGMLSPAVNATVVEAFRRTGDLSTAVRILGRVNNSEQLAPGLDGVRIRMAVDQGQLDEAGDVLARALVRSPFQGDILAAAWYLARQGGDAAEIADWETQWALVNRSPWRTLPQYLPENGGSP